MIVTFVLMAIAMVVGAGIGQIGMRWRINRMDGVVRNLRRELYDHELFEGELVPTQWVIDRLDALIEAEFSR